MTDPFIHRMQFSSNDYDEFATMFSVANVEEQILESGNFSGKVHIIQSPHVIINNFIINKKVFQIGTGIPGYITFTIWDPKTTFHWRNHQMKRGMIGVLWKNEHQSVTGSNFNGIPISLEENFFINLCQNKGYPELIDLIEESELLFVSEFQLNNIRQIIQFISRNENLSDNLILVLLEEILMDLLFNCLLKSLPKISKANLSSTKFSKTIDFIHSNLTQITSVNEVCRFSKIPERTLRRMFQKNYGLSPKKYIHSLRLNEVRKSLKNNFNDLRVIQAASEYNFWHMGQFTRDYKRLFNELPSKTLASAR